MVFETFLEISIFQIIMMLLTILAQTVTNYHN